MADPMIVTNGNNGRFTAIAAALVNYTGTLWRFALATMFPLSETLYDDAVLPAARIPNAPGSNPPAFSTSEVAHSYVINLDRDVELVFEPGHRYKEGSNVELHLHHHNSDSNGGNVRYSVQYRVETPGVALPAWSGATTGTFPSGSTTAPQITSILTHAAATATIGSVFKYKLTLTRNHASDTYNGTLYADSYGIHFILDTMGSASISAK